MTIDEIKQTVTIRDVISRYGLETDRKGFMPCPFHSEKTGSLRIYDDTNSFFCFGCGAGGSVIDFIMKMEDCSFSEAAKRLGGEDNLSLWEKRKIALAKREQERIKKKQEAVKEKYYEVLKEYIRLDRNLALYKPKTPDEPLHPLFAEALRKIDYQSYLIDCFDESW